MVTHKFLQVHILTTLKRDCVEIQMEQRQAVEQPPLWQKQILPHLSLFCLKASHRYDFLPSVRELKMRISKLGVRESCRSLTLDSHLLSSWTCECWSWSIWRGRASSLFSHLLSTFFLCFYLSTISSLCNGFFFFFSIYSVPLFLFIFLPQLAV